MASTASSIGRSIASGVPSQSARVVVGDALRRGKLVPLLRQFQVVPDSAIYLVYLPNRTLSSRVRVLIDFLVERFGPTPSWEVGW